MVSLQSLIVFAGVALLLAAAAGWLRRIELRDALAEGLAALAAALLLLAASAALFALSRHLGAPEPWRGAGSVALLATPLGATLALRARGRRSIPRALFTSVIALAGVVLWLTLNLRGPRAGWSLADAAPVVFAAAVAVAAAACLGWWTKRRRVG